MCPESMQAIFFSQTGKLWAQKALHVWPAFLPVVHAPLLELGSRCNLERACQEHNIDYQAAHIAAVDADFI